MEAHEQILELMDSCWFQRRIIFQNKHEAEFKHRKIDDKNGEKKSTVSPGIQNLQIRSFSERCIGVGFQADSPTSVIIKPKLQKIPSGEEAPFFGERENRREKQRSMISRSLSALEFEELKGFMDLGFVFNEEEETNPSLVSIVPGLQKWRKMAAEEEEGGEGDEMKARVSRPYLSEAWGDLCRRRGNEYRKKLITNWKIPSVKNEIDMKDHLKNWAHVVASTVR